MIMITQEDNILIELYLEGDLSSAQIATFRERFNSDPEFAREVKHNTDLKIALKTLMKHRLKGQKETPVKMMSSFYLKLAIAASIILLLGIPAYFAIKSTPAHKTLYAGYYSNPLDGEQWLIRSGDMPEDKLVKENFREAIIAMEKQNFAFAITTLEEMNAMPHNAASSTIQWYLGLAYLGNGNLEYAAAIFTIVFNSNSEYSQRALELYNKVMDLVDE